MYFDDQIVPDEIRGNPLIWLLNPLDTSPSFLEHILTFWKKMLQANFVLSVNLPGVLRGIQKSRYELALGGYCFLACLGDVETALGTHAGLVPEPRLSTPSPANRSHTKIPECSSLYVKYHSTVGSPCFQFLACGYRRLCVCIQLSISTFIYIY